MKVSVVMAGRNSKPDLLRDAISSIFNQTFQDFEFIFVDDGSDNPMEPMVKSISHDERISVYRIDPSGLGAALNYGIKKSSGEYIARLDDDDISLPTRLEKQVSYLDEHPEVSCVGTQLYYKYDNKVYPHSPFPINHEGILERLACLHFAIAHTSIMFRRSAFAKIGGYRIPGGGQDLDLFFQLGTVGNLANLDEYLVCYTLSLTGLSVVNPKKTQAYIFALESALNKDVYSSYSPAIRESIKRLKGTPPKSYLERIGLSKRKVLLLIVRFLGKRVIFK